MSDYDMVVIGSGFAGSAAVLSFLEGAEKEGRDGRVALIESGKLGTWPGSSRWARPFLRLGRDNELLRDRVDGDLANDEYWRRFEDEVPNTVKFMVDHGVKLIPHEEKDAALDFEGRHFVFLGSGGKEIVDYYLSYVITHAAADALWDHEATGLTSDDEGRVNGVVVREPDGSSRTITADAVVLACGGFEGNPEMLSEHLGADATDLPIIARGLRYNRGAGISMAMEVGADTAGTFDMVHAELVDPRATKYHPAIWGQNYGIVVNEESERFCDEGGDYIFATSETIAYETWRSQNQKSYFITDESVMERFAGSWVYESNVKPPERSDTIAGLAEKLGLNPDDLEATVREFNEACGSGDWDPAEMDGNGTTGISPAKSNWAKPIVEAPFSGFPMTAHLVFTFGGLKVDADGRVLDTDGAPISGLYAAGEITGHFHDKQPPATSVLRANTFGRIVGTSVADSLPRTAAAKT